jgi:hypothetical protein
MGQTASVPMDTTPGERDVKRQRRHSSQASASEKMESGSKRVSSRHSRMNSGSSTSHSRKSSHGGDPALLPRKKSTRSSRSSTSHKPDAFQAKSEDSSAPRERGKRRKPKMSSPAQLQTPETATRLIKRRDKAVFEVQSALQMLGKYGTGGQTSLIQLSVEDLCRLEDGFKRVRDLLDYISIHIEPYNSRRASKILAYKTVLTYNTAGLSDIGKTRAMLRRISRELGKVGRYTTPTELKTSREGPQRGSSLASLESGVWIHDLEVKFATKPSSTPEIVDFDINNDLDPHPESWYPGSEVSNTSKSRDQTRSQFVPLAGPSTTMEDCSKAPPHMTGTILNPVDLTLPDASFTRASIDDETSKGLKEKVVRFRALTSGNVDYPQLPSSLSQIAKGKGKAKEEVEGLATNDLQKRLAALRKSTAETVSPRKGTSSVTFSRPLVTPAEPVLSPPVASQSRQPLTEKRNAWAGNLRSPTWNEFVGEKKQARAEQEVLSTTVARFSLTVLPTVTDVASYMQLSNVDIVEFAVIDAYGNPVEGFTWITSAPSRSMKIHDAECTTIIRNHAAEKLKANPRAICSWFTTVSVDYTEQPRNITTLSKQRVNIFLDPYIRLVVGHVMHTVDYSKRMTAEKLPVNKACVTVGDLRKRAETQLSIHKKQRFKLFYQGVILHNDTAELKEACSFTQRILQGWDPLYINVEIETKRDCVVCGDELSVSRFSPTPITSTCDHEINSCRKCVREWIKSSLKNNGPDKLKCTECPAVLQHADVKAHASSRQFEK